MTMYARNDLVAVTISPTHGGCGDVHSRPVVEGAPVKLWALECANGCEDALRKDAHWSSTISGIPETPDETAYREDQELKGRQDQQNQTAEALAKLSSLGDLPSALAQLAAMFGSATVATPSPASTQTCTGCGTSLLANAKFCPECGLRADVQIPEEAGGYGTYENMDMTELKELAAAKGVSVRGNLSKATLIDRLRTA